MLIERWQSAAYMWNGSFRIFMTNAEILTVHDLWVPEYPQSVFFGEGDM